MNPIYIRHPAYFEIVDELSFLISEIGSDIEREPARAA
jgi:hypothetical protein